MHARPHSQLSEQWKAQIIRGAALETQGRMDSEFLAGPELGLTQRLQHLCFLLGPAAVLASGLA